MSELEEVRLILKNVQEIVHECKSMLNEFDASIVSLTKAVEIDAELEKAIKSITATYKKFEEEDAKRPPRKSRRVKR